MAGLMVGFMVLPLALGFLIAGLVRLANTVRSRGSARSAQARSLGASAATGVVGLTATVAWLGLARGLNEDIRLSTLPALGCAATVLTAAVAELTWPRPTGSVRTASLDPRRARRPAWLSRLVVVGIAATAAALAVGALTAASDGRSFARRAGDVAATGSPYPGQSYGVVVGIAVTVLALATWFAWARVDARPALGPGHEDLDAAVRGASMVRVLRPAAVGTLSTAAGLWLTIGATVNQVTQNLRMNDSRTPQPPFDWVQNLGFVAITIGVVLVLLTLAALLSGSPRLPREDAAPAPGIAEVGA
ncbi:hypothetical protein [Pedococcus bigeumensis]|uniref:Uncharacterized protein n=1 Tax=Pedococcus bigeumensis TaxID=433644 RepID=A0A502CQZ8_9MICO|nr:hypothetical protein [Pedococcus bigeumensis]TPG14121.1 hypothetical protein EAH86_18185 [Pedococcus bigeumensis]